MSFPGLGMYYDDCARRIKRLQKSNMDAKAKRNMVLSLKNQCRLNHGESGLQELENECAFEYVGSPFSGRGNRQIGFGEGKRLGEGNWIYKDGKWEKV